jgi:hypothetical protein
MKSIQFSIRFIAFLLHLHAVDLDQGAMDVSSSSVHLFLTRTGSELTFSSTVAGVTYSGNKGDKLLVGALQNLNEALKYLSITYDGDAGLSLVIVVNDGTLAFSFSRFFSH